MEKIVNMLAVVVSILGFAPTEKQLEEQMKPSMDRARKLATHYEPFLFRDLIAGKKDENARYHLYKLAATFAKREKIPMRFMVRFYRAYLQTMMAELRTRLEVEFQGQQRWTVKSYESLPFRFIGLFETEEEARAIGSEIDSGVHRVTDALYDQILKDSNPEWGCVWDGDDEDMDRIYATAEEAGAYDRVDELLYRLKMELDSCDYDIRWSIRIFGM